MSKQNDSFSQNKEGNDQATSDGGIDFGDFRRLTPIDSFFGYHRGTPIDRYYIERFLDQHRNDIQGHVLEIGDNYYTKTYGTNVTKSDVLHVDETRKEVTIIADLTKADHLPSNIFNCIIFTQTLQCIYDVHSAITTIHRILAPDGVLLGTYPVITKIGRYEMDRWGEYWRFTNKSVNLLHGEIFSNENIAIEAYGNILVAASFLYGLAAEDLQQQELDYFDPDFEFILMVRAVKKVATLTTNESYQ